jgi:Calx-beta domain/FG-GAP-like repeat
MEIPMWMPTFFKSLTSTPTRRRPVRRRPPASRLSLEALEDRSMPSFLGPVNYAAGTSPQAVVTVDFNNDGRLDVATANYGSSNVSVLLGNADGSFQPAQNSATGAGPLSLAVGDFNADGRLDLATANTGNVSVLLGNGNGTFQAPTNIGIGSSPTSVAVGDFNGDGNLDLGATSNGPGYDFYIGYANVLLGTGTGSFAAPVASFLGFGYHTSAAVADFNGDGKQDFATVNTESDTVSVLLGNTAGLGAPTNFTTGSFPRAVTVGDFTGDGILDLAAAGILAGEGNGAFPWVSLGYGPAAMAPADFNGDGKLDLVTVGYGDTVSVLLGAGDGAFRPPIDVATGMGTVGVAVGDFNGDARPDIATANVSFNNVSVLLNDGAWLAVDAPLLFINDVTVTEGNTGTVSAEFKVTLSAAYGQTVSIDYATADGSATVAGGDYQEKSGTLTFAPGDPLTQNITVLVNGDRDHEYQESFNVRLSNPTHAFLADATAVGTIQDDEPRVSIVNYVTNLEGNTGTTAYLFTVTLSAAYDVPVTVDYATADLTPDDEYSYGPGATAGVDYTATSGTMIFNPGEPLSQDIIVLVNGDRVGESYESFFVNLSNPTYAQLDSTQALGIIEDDEPYVSIDGGGAVVEGNSGTKNVTFTVTLSAASDAPVTVTYATADGSATAGSDYQAQNGTLTFAPGETSKPITVLVNGDRIGEANEAFFVVLSNPGNATIADGTGQGTGTILDDEPHISISDVTKKEGNGKKTVLFTFTVTLSAAYDQAVTMSYRTVDGTATTSNNDYTAKTGTLTFAPGETTKTITIEVKGDSKKETDEYFYLDLFGNSSNALFTKKRGIGTILNDD